MSSWPEFASFTETSFAAELHLPIANDPDNIPEFTALVRDLLQRISAESDDFLSEIRVALEEALTNAIIHGNLSLSSSALEDRTQARKRIRDRMQQAPYCDRRARLTIRVHEQAIVLLIRDEGKGFAPAEVANPLDPENLSRSHGRGLLMIRSFMDEVRHNEEGNEITMIKLRQ